MIKIFIANLDRYEESANPEKLLSDFGEWFELPIEPSEYGKVICETIGSSSVKGYRILSTESQFDELVYDDSDNMWQANIDAITLEYQPTLTDEEIFIVNGLMAERSCTLEDAIDDMKKYKVYYDCEDEESLGRMLAEEADIEFNWELDEYIRWEDFAYDRTGGVYFFYEYCCIAEL